MSRNKLINLKIFLKRYRLLKTLRLHLGIFFYLILLVYSLRYDGDEVASSELERMQIECLRRLFDEGFNILNVQYG